MAGIITPPTMVWSSHSLVFPQRQLLDLVAHELSGRGEQLLVVLQAGVQAPVLGTQHSVQDRHLRGHAQAFNTHLHTSPGP